MHVFSGEIPCFREIQTRGTSDAWDGEGYGMVGTSGKLGDPHLSSELFALSLTVSPLHSPESRPYLAPSFSKSLSLSLPTIPFFVVAHPLGLTRYSPYTSPSHEWPKEEMCLCLDCRQIICGNKFLCV